MEHRIVIVGGGFAGVWAAAAAIAATRSAGHGASVSLLTTNTSLSIRPRLYEADLEPTVVDLAAILEPIGVQLHVAPVTHIDPRRRLLEAADATTVPFDAAVLATGSSTPLPPLPGAAEHAHRIDVHRRASSFQAALAEARGRGRAVRVTVVGGGLTGIELATELASEPDLDITLIDGGTVGATLGAAAMEVVRAALADLSVKVMDGARVVSVTGNDAALQGGGSVEHDLLVWTGGLRANGVDGLDSFEHDDLGRLLVDQHLRLRGGTPIWAAGDSARFVVDGSHVAPMSCQFAIPSGQLAGYNAAASVVGLEALPLSIGRYVTCVDLGRAGGLLTRGWDRVVALTGEEGKRMKEFINRTAIYPPTTPGALLEAAAHPAAGLGWG